MDVNKNSKFILKLINDVVLILILFIVGCFTGYLKTATCLMIMVFVWEFNDDIFNYITKNKYNKKECK